MSPNLKARCIKVFNRLEPISVISSNVSEVRLHPHSRSVFVTFKQGSVYVGRRLSPERFEEIEQALENQDVSIGKLFNSYKKEDPTWLVQIT